MATRSQTQMIHTKQDVVPHSISKRLHPREGYCELNVCLH